MREETPPNALDARLRAIEERLDLLERRKAPPQPSADPELWALEALAFRGIDGVTYAGHVNVPQHGTLGWQITLPTSSVTGQRWTDAAPVLAALGHPVRLELLRAVLNGLGTTQELSTVTTVGTTGQLYHHLRELQAAGWVMTPTRGQYRVPAERVVPLLTILVCTNTLPHPEVTPT